MIHRLFVSILVFGLPGCVPVPMPMPMPAGPGMTQATAAPARGGCALMARYGAGSTPYGAAPYGAAASLGYAMSASIRALQNFADCGPQGGPRTADATHPQPGQTTQATPQLEALLAQKNACTETVRDRPEFAKVASHFSDIKTGRFSMVQLSDEARPTPPEARLVAKYYDSSLPCIQALATSFAKLAPADGAVLDRSIADQQSVVTQLATRRISWGEFARQSQKISEQAEAKFQTAGL